MPLTIVRNDITKMTVDAIVNPADTGKPSLGGCCGAILRAAGHELIKACTKLGSCPVGEARITPGFNLDAKYVIHTAGPVWNGRNGNETALLKNCYTNSLRLAAQNGIHTIAFPLLSAGVFGFPAEVAVAAAREAITAFLYDEDENDTEVFLVLFTRSAMGAGGEQFRRVAQYIDDNYEGIRHFESELPERRMRNSAFIGRASRPYSPKSESSECFVLYDADESASEAAAKLDDMLLKELDEGFSRRLIRLIDERGLTDSYVYRRANKDRKLFNKIKLNEDYHPGKQTVLAFAVALRLNLDETKQLLESAGYALTRASKGDLIVKFHIENGEYDIMKINEELFRFDQQLL